MSRIIDEQVKKAIREGQLDDLPGKGKPLPDDPFASLPEEVRNTYRILKNSGFVPPEVEKRQQIAKLREELAALNPDSDEARDVRRKIALKEIEVSMAGERLRRMSWSSS